MSTSAPSVTLRMPDAVLWAVGLGVTALGFGLGFAVKPLAHWLIDTVGGAPGPLRLVSMFPTAGAVAVCTAAGAVAGAWLAYEWRKESLDLTVGPDSVQLAQKGAERYVPRERVGEVFRDAKDLVILDPDTKEVARHAADDLSWDEVRAAFERLGYPWAGTGDPHEREFRRWRDGEPELDEKANGLLRSRARALADKRHGAAADLADELQANGIVVRDRDGAQEYRRLPAGE
ncbi:hypothetical protein B0I33_11115 [Prauserella shujinwangii]|uniref:DUF308 domain-containing protein n=1 Tax=Prauserella shujinwangii TaxID=1453103 RepID=A0A2T0LMT8_9PSEU|nr:hypothetical protein [Prauserella shujinwangii]PRX44507.1 hypothetical protein B0I33_11115 [Prauserella shujinwangii]